MLRYFCYVSEAKVNQLLDQINGEIPLETTKETVVETNRGLNPSLQKVLSLFSLGATYGRTNRLTTSQVNRTTVVHRMQRVLTFMVKSGQIHDLRATLMESKKLTGQFYSYVGGFKVREYDEHMATLESSITQHFSVQLACSMEYFSHMGRKENKPVPHSGNWQFFEGKVVPTFETVLIPQDYQDGTLYGSPLFLALHTEIEVTL